MATHNPYAAYQTTQTVTASQTKLLVMLHDGAIRFLAQAAIATSQRDFYTKSVHLNKAMAILAHLWDTLDHERGGELSANLERVYKQLHSQLVIANVKDDIGAMKRVMAHLREMRQSWAAVDAGLAAMPNAAPEVAAPASAPGAAASSGDATLRGYGRSAGAANGLKVAA